jgi:hypothetical protein
VSCTKARAAFEAGKQKIGEEVDAKKSVIGPDAVWEFLAQADTVHVASGQKTITYTPDSSTREELLNKATGRTGNLRAPALRIGNDLYIGYNQAMYDALFSR